MATFRSKMTGLVGEYPASHAELDDDLVLVEDGEVCVDCVVDLPPAVIPVEVTKPRRNKEDKDATNGE